MNQLIKFLLSSLILFFTTSLVFSQSLYHHNNNSTIDNYLLSDVKKFTYDNEDMNLFLNDGTILTIDLNDLSYFNYKSPTGVENTLDVLNSLGLNLFPNPVSDNININYSLTKNDKVLIELLSFDGKLVDIIFEGNQSEGKQYVDSSLQSLPSGNYFIKISSTSFQITKKVIKN